MTSLEDLLSTQSSFDESIATMAAELGIDFNKSIKACQSFGEVYPDPSMSPYFYGPFIVAYLFLFIFGLCGNLLLMYVTLKHKTLQVGFQTFLVFGAGLLLGDLCKKANT